MRTAHCCAPPCAERAVVLEFIASPFSPSSVRRQARLQSVGKPMSRPLEARVMSVVGSRGTRDRCPCHVRGRLPRDRRPSTVGRVVLNAPHEMPPPHHRPSWDSWIRPSLTDARPSPVRQKSVGRLVCRPSEARCASVSRRAICRRARTPHEPTQDERPTGSDRTTNERRTNNRRTHTRPLDRRPAKARGPSLARVKSVTSPLHVRGKSV